MINNRRKEIDKFISEYDKSIWYSYEDIYVKASELFSKLPLEKNKYILLSIGRGGWMVSRILSSFFERESVQHYSYTVITTFNDANTINERAEFIQKLDKDSIMKIRKLINLGYKILIIDGPYVTGRTNELIRNYLLSMFGSVYESFVLDVIKFNKSISCPWRIPPDYLPEFYGIQIMTGDEVLYVQYPWEWASLDLYNIVTNCFKLKLNKDKLIFKIDQYEKNNIGI